MNGREKRIKRHSDEARLALDLLQQNKDDIGLAPVALLIELTDVIYKILYYLD